MAIHICSFVAIVGPPPPACPWCDEAPAVFKCSQSGCDEMGCAACAARVEERDVERSIEDERERREDAYWSAVDAAIDQWKEDRYERGGTP